ncbi:MAG: hypothetical protein ACKVOQ_13400 [Cyclobacteriaceae bacterium]
MEWGENQNKREERGREWGWTRYKVGGTKYELRITRDEVQCLSAFVAAAS